MPLTDNQAVSRLSGEIICQKGKGLSDQAWPHGWSCFEEFEQENSWGPFQPQLSSGPMKIKCF